MILISLMNDIEKTMTIRSIETKPSNLSGAKQDWAAQNPNLAAKWLREGQECSLERAEIITAARTAGTEVTRCAPG